MSENWTIRICKTCGKEFQYYINPANKNNATRGQFCSVKCRWEIRRAITVCETCGKEYIYYPNNSSKKMQIKFCSKMCANGGTLKQRFEKHLSNGVVNEGGCILCYVPDGEKYSRISFGVGCRGKSARPKFAHRVAYELKHGKIPDGLHVLHRCDNPACANVDHLFLGTPSDNMADKVAKNRQIKGSMHVLSKLTESQVLEIRSKYTKTRGSLTNLAKEYGVRKQTIMKVVKREIWRHV